MKSAFPGHRSPTSIPEKTWEKCVVAYETWRYIFYSDGLFYQGVIDSKRHRRYLKEMIKRIADEPLEEVAAPKILAAPDRLVRVIRAAFPEN